MKYYIINYSDNEMKSYQSSLDRSDDDFNFSYDDNDDAQNFSKVFILLFCFLFLFLNVLKK